MTPLRKRMIDEMGLRNFAPKTVDPYVDNVAKLARHFGRSPGLLGEKEVRQCLVHLVEERKLAWGNVQPGGGGAEVPVPLVLKRGASSAKSATSAARGACDTCWWCLDEVRRFLAAIVSHKHRMVLTTAYSAGLRVSEVVNLHVADVDAARMVTIHRPYVNYEIEQSIARGNGLIGIYIHNCADRTGFTCAQGLNPLDYHNITVKYQPYAYSIPMNRIVRASQHYKTYDWINNNGYNNFENWVDEAYRLAGKE